MVQSFEQGETCALESGDSDPVGQIFPDISEGRSALEMPRTAVAPWCIVTSQES